MGLSLENFDGDQKNYFESYKHKADALFKFIKNASIKIFRDQCSKKENLEMISLDKNDYKTILEKKAKSIANNISNVKNIKLKLQNIEEKEKFIKKNIFAVKNDLPNSKKSESKNFKKNDEFKIREKGQDLSDYSKLSLFDNSIFLSRERSKSNFSLSNNLDLNLKKPNFNLKRSSVQVNLPVLPLKNNDGKRRSVSFAEKPVFIKKLDQTIKDSIFLTERKNESESFQAKKPNSERKSILGNFNYERKLYEIGKKSELETSINSETEFALYSDKKSDLSLSSARKSVLFSKDVELSKRKKIESKTFLNSHSSPQFSDYHPKILNTSEKNFKLDSSNKASIIYDPATKNPGLKGSSKHSIISAYSILEPSSKNYDSPDRRASSLTSRDKNNNNSFLIDNEREKDQKEGRIRLESKIKEFDDLTQKAIKNEGKVKRTIRGNSYGKMGPVKDVLVFDTK